ncbi:DUF4926 domain-containing protein [Burkholderia sp. MSMB1072]
MSRNRSSRGYIIEDYGNGNCEVEFSRPDGTTKALTVITADRLASGEE